MGRHQGGYVPFEVELTPFAKKGEKATVELRVWDAPSSVANKDWRLYGKQGYGNARGVWQTDVFVNGKFVDRHQGGYVPFEVELTPFAKKGGKATVELRVWDAPASISGKDWRLYGKQGYGNARGVWQTVYLEGRGESYIESVRFTPYFATSLCETCESAARCHDRLQAGGRRR